MSPIETFKNFVGNANPKDILMRMIGKNSNPIVSNLMQMAQNGDAKGVENFARNMCKEKGVDFDKEFASFMNNFKK